MMLYTMSPEIGGKRNIKKEFITAGIATFTVSNASNAHFTFQVKYREPNFYVGVLRGTFYAYLGILDIETGWVRPTKASQIGKNGLDLKVARWSLRRIWREEYPPMGYKIEHDGHCSKCGRGLTNPKSLDTGIGPICSKNL